MPDGARVTVQSGIAHGPADSYRTKLEEVLKKVEAIKAKPSKTIDFFVKRLPYVTLRSSVLSFLFSNCDKHTSKQKIPCAFSVAKTVAQFPPPPPPVS